MQVVLRSDQVNLGKRGDIVEVADGYARNFLLPKGHAIVATQGIKAQAEAMRRARDIKDRKAREGAEELARRMVGAELALMGNAAHEGKLYGSVGIAEILEALKDAFGVDLDRRAIKLEEPIREIGSHDVAVILHPEVQITVTIVVGE